MKVTRLPKDPGPAGWNAILPSRPPSPPLAGRQTADWLVIGAGFAGLSAARRLSQICPSDRIVVLDARQVAEGPAGRNSGFMIDLPHDLGSDNYSGALAADRATTTDNRHAIEFAADMATDYRMPDEAFTRSGKINAAATAKGHAHNLEFAKHLTAMGEPSTTLDAAQMHEMTGTDYYQSGLATPGTATIQPALYIRSVADGLVSNGVTLHENTPVTALDRQGDWVATTPTGHITAPKVILAVNGHLNSFGFLPGRLMHVFTYASMTRALAPAEVATLGGHPVWGVTPSDPMGTTVRRISGTGGDRIIVRNRFTFDPRMEVSDGRIASVARDHDRAFKARFPMLGHVDMAYRWGGRLCLSRNNVQVIGEVDQGLFAACCQNGLGTVRGTLAGMLAAEAATGTNSDALTRAQSAADPQKLPPAPIAGLGAALRLKWSEFKAGREL